jgi:excinuclease ABC subunit A
LATELGKKDTGKTFYILDEPTTGLHFQDIQLLIGVLNSGLSPVMTAFLMGNSPEVALKNYTHQLQITKELPNI